MLAATAMSAIGGGIGALQASSQSRYAARIADRNASLEREAAQQSILTTREESLAHYRRVAGLKGAQRAWAAAGGVGVDFGTAADVLVDTDMLANDDLRRIQERGTQRTRGYEINASNFMGEASAQRQAATGAMIGGAFDFGSTILGGATQYSNFQRNNSRLAAKLPRTTFG